MAKRKRPPVKSHSDEQRLDAIAVERALLDKELSKFQRPITVMFVDMMGTTKFFDEHGDVAGFLRMRNHVETVRVTVAQYGGNLAKTAGDIVLVWFDEPENALHAAVDLLKRIQEQNLAPRVHSEEVHLCMGLNYGTALIKDGEPFGHAVKLAARIKAIAGADQILMSALLEEKVRGAGFTIRKVSDAAALPGGEQIELHELLWRDAS